MRGPEPPTTRPFVSIIIPAFNEEHRLPRSLERIVEWSESVAWPIEILVVENGSSDRTTEVAEAYAGRHRHAKLIHSDKGKGAAVREGVLRGCGEFLFVCDADLSMPIEEIANFLPPRLEEFDVAIGSREAPGAVRYGEPEYRHLLGRLFNTLVRAVALPGCQDSQCGFKMFRREAALEIFPLVTLTGQAFDVEALFIARKSGARVCEVPIRWHYDPDSRVRPLRDGWKMVRDLVRIRVRDALGRYDGERARSGISASGVLRS